MDGNEDALGNSPLILSPESDNGNSPPPIFQTRAAAVDLSGNKGAALTKARSFPGVWRPTLTVNPSFNSPAAESFHSEPIKLFAKKAMSLKRSATQDTRFSSQMLYSNGGSDETLASNDSITLSELATREEIIRLMRSEDFEDVSCSSLSMPPGFSGLPNQVASHRVSSQHLPSEDFEEEVDALPEDDGTTDLVTHSSESSADVVPTSNANIVEFSAVSPVKLARSMGGSELMSELQCDHQTDKSAPVIQESSEIHKSLETTTQKKTIAVASGNKPDFLSSQEMEKWEEAYWSIQENVHDSKPSPQSAPLECFEKISAADTITSPISNNSVIIAPTETDLVQPAFYTVEKISDNSKKCVLDLFKRMHLEFTKINGIEEVQIEKPISESFVETANTDFKMLDVCENTEKQLEKSHVYSNDDCEGAFPSIEDDKLKASSDSLQEMEHSEASTDGETEIVIEEKIVPIATDVVHTVEIIKPIVETDLDRILESVDEIARVSSEHESLEDKESCSNLYENDLKLDKPRETVACNKKITSLIEQMDSLVVTDGICSTKNQTIEDTLFLDVARSESHNYVIDSASPLKCETRLLPQNADQFSIASTIETPRHGKTDDDLNQEPEEKPTKFGGSGRNNSQNECSVSLKSDQVEATLIIDSGTPNTNLQNELLSQIAIVSPDDKPVLSQLESLSYSISSDVAQNVIVGSNHGSGDNNSVDESHGSKVTGKSMTPNSIGDLVEPFLIDLSQTTLDDSSQSDCEAHLESTENDKNECGTNKEEVEDICSKDSMSHPQSVLPDSMSPYTVGDTGSYLPLIKDFSPISLDVDKLNDDSPNSSYEVHEKGSDNIENLLDKYDADTGDVNDICSKDSPSLSYSILLENTTDIDLSTKSGTTFEKVEVNSELMPNSETVDSMDDSGIQSNASNSNHSHDEIIVSYSQIQGISSEGSSKDAKATLDDDHYEDKISHDRGESHSIDGSEPDLFEEELEDNKISQLEHARSTAEVTETIIAVNDIETSFARSVSVEIKSSLSEEPLPTATHDNSTTTNSGFEEDCEQNSEMGTFKNASASYSEKNQNITSVDDSQSMIDSLQMLVSTKAGSIFDDDHSEDKISLDGEHFNFIDSREPELIEEEVKDDQTSQPDHANLTSVVLITKPQGENVYSLEDGIGQKSFLSSGIHGQVEHKDDNTDVIAELKDPETNLNQDDKDLFQNSQKAAICTSFQSQSSECEGVELSIYSGEVDPIHLNDDCNLPDTRNEFAISAAYYGSKVDDKMLTDVRDKLSEPASNDTLLENSIMSNSNKSNNSSSSKSLDKEDNATIVEQHSLESNNIICSPSPDSSNSCKSDQERASNQIQMIQITMDTSQKLESDEPQKVNLSSIVHDTDDQTSEHTTFDGPTAAPLQASCSLKSRFNSSFDLNQLGGEQRKSEGSNISTQTSSPDTSEGKIECVDKPTDAKANETTTLEEECQPEIIEECEECHQSVESDKESVVKNSNEENHSILIQDSSVASEVFAIDNFDHLNRKDLQCNDDIAASATCNTNADDILPSSKCSRSTDESASQHEYREASTIEHERESIRRYSYYQSQGFMLNPTGNVSALPDSRKKHRRKKPGRIDKVLLLLSSQFAGYESMSDFSTQESSQFSNGSDSSDTVGDEEDEVDTDKCEGNIPTPVTDDEHLNGRVSSDIASTKRPLATTVQNSNSLETEDEVSVSEPDSTSQNLPNPIDATVKQSFSSTDEFMEYLTRFFQDDIKQFFLEKSNTLMRSLGLPQTTPESRLSGNSKQDPGDSKKTPCRQSEELESAPKRKDSGRTVKNSTPAEISLPSDSIGNETSEETIPSPPHKTRKLDILAYSGNKENLTPCAGLAVDQESTTNSTQDSNSAQRKQPLQVSQENEVFSSRISGDASNRKYPEPVAKWKCLPGTHSSPDVTPRAASIKSSSSEMSRTTLPLRLGLSRRQRNLRPLHPYLRLSKF